MSERACPEHGILNGMTVDVEEHFQVSAFESVVRRDDWQRMPSRVEANTGKVLDILDDCGVQATFFVLGWIGERFPALVREIAERGHEIGCHGWSHRLAYEQQPEEFREETLRARGTLQQVSGQSVAGYRAASFSIDRRNPWALDVLVEAGFAYDSSRFPIRHDRYGVPGAPRRIHWLDSPSGRRLLEIPPSTVRVAGGTFPAAGGGYLRILPGALARWAVGRLNRKEQMPAVVYVHPWELDAGQPRIEVPLRSRLRHYTGLRTTERKLRDLMDRYPFGPLRAVVDRHGPAGANVDAGGEPAPETHDDVHRTIHAR